MVKNNVRPYQKLSNNEFNNHDTCAQNVKKWSKLLYCLSSVYIASGKSNNYDIWYVEEVNSSCLEENFTFIENFDFTTRFCIKVSKNSPKWHSLWPQQRNIQQS